MNNDLTQFALQNKLIAYTKQVASDVAFSTDSLVDIAFSRETNKCNATFQKIAGNVKCEHIIEFTCDDTDEISKALIIAGSVISSIAYEAKLAYLKLPVRYS